MDNFCNKFNKYELANFGLVRLPEINIPVEQKTKLGLAPETSNKEILHKLVEVGLQNKKKYLKHDKQKYLDQVKFELDLIEELGFTDYFLLVWIVVNKARELGAYIDPGRGSCTASTCFYLMGITGVDPIDKKLLFARFISKVRAKKQIINGVTYLQGDLAPDVDLNLSSVREDIVEWLNTIYQGKIAKIATVSVLTGKILIKDVYKTIEGVSEEEAKYVADMIDKHFGIVADIESMPEKNKLFKDWSEKHPLVFKIALKLRDINRQIGCHASGYVISFHELNGFIPLQLNKDKELMSSYAMEDVSNIAIKLDLLGLTCNEIVKDVLDNIPEKVEDINLEDSPIIYDQFQSGKLLPYGLYQISADCTYKALLKIKPKNINELSDLNAISRPGALSYLDSYVANNHLCPHPIFENILSPTRNHCLYQEQMMQMAVAMGFTVDESELIRKIAGKKEVEKVKSWKEKVYKKCEENNLDTSIGDLFWKILDDSAKYSFNKGHSLGVSYLGALTTYLKYKYPIQFYLACLKSAKSLPNPLEEIGLINKELHYFGIKLLAPHILKSDLDFQIEGNNIRMGLTNIKGVSEKTISKIVKFKNNYSNKFEIFHGAEEAGINITVLSSCIQAGALDDNLNQSRPRTVLEAQLWRLLTTKEKQYIIQLGDQLNFDLLKIIKYLKDEKKDEKGKPIIKESRYETIKKNYQKYKEIYERNRKNETLANYWHERKVLGFSYADLRGIYSDFYDGLLSVEEVKNADKNEYIFTVGFVEESNAWITKSEKKTRCFKIKVSDEISSIDVLMFNDKIEMCKENNGNKLPKEGDIVLIKGKKMDDSVFADKITIQQQCERFDPKFKEEKTKKSEKGVA